MKQQKGFIQIPLLIAIIVAFIGVVSAGTSIVLYKQGKLAPLVANISEALKMDKNTIPSDQGTTEQELSEVDKLRQEVDELKKQQAASVPTQKNTESVKSVTPEQVPVKTPPTEENFRDVVVTAYAKQAEIIKLFVESSDTVNIISDMKDRRGRLMNRVSFIKQNMYFSNLTHDTIIFNQMLDEYVNAHEKEIKYINDNLQVVNNNLALLNGYQTDYNNKVSALLSDPKKFVTREELIIVLQYEGSTGLDHVYDSQQRIIQAFKYYYQSVVSNEDQYSQAATIMKSALLTMGASSAPSEHTYYQPMPQTIFTMPESPKNVNCTITGDGGVGLQMYVNCTSF